MYKRLDVGAVRFAVRVTGRKHIRNMLEDVHTNTCPQYTSTCVHIQCLKKFT